MFLNSKVYISESQKIIISHLTSLVNIFFCLNKKCFPSATKVENKMRIAESKMKKNLHALF